MLIDVRSAISLISSRSARRPRTKWRASPLPPAMQQRLPYVPRRCSTRSVSSSLRLCSADIVGASSVLALEVWAALRRPADRSRTPGINPQHEPAESDVGSAANSGRAVDAWHRGRRVNGRNDICSRRPTVVTGMENILAQRGCPNSRHRYFRGPQHLTQTALWAGDS